MNIPTDSPSDPPTFSDAQLVAFLDEELQPELSSKLESALRADPELQQRLTVLRGQNLAGLHSIGAIWRRGRLSCLDRPQLAAFLAGTLPTEEADYARFHLDEIHCRVCNANVDDLKQAAAENNESQDRRDRLFQSSAGHLRPKL
ncbi:hypothetical protein SAMN06265222_101236 [Neorhodopirellula lusitana]|uniref:Uncharacterized protein n=1 Tax=Neorhodopirellula lusitana TaxID=445327 RepID=A0ABY1PNM7_9BACT|nr:hypothetical protein [Neorhodopirellula lusitana]SMP39022.1 hypothetical protein SAMN06265222_101236 [Neorhodopirellula lusitana]